MTIKALRHSLLKCSILLSKIDRNSNKQQGVVLLIVILFLALSSILVVNLVHSAYLQSEAMVITKNRLKAEYILKSLVNYAVALIDANADPKESSNICADNTKSWCAPFLNGSDLPQDIASILGVKEGDGIRIALEILPQSGFSLSDLWSNARNLSKTVLAQRRVILLNLFYLLGFEDSSDESNIPASGPYEGRFFSPEELIGNLIDYLDDDDESCSDETYDSQLYAGSSASGSFNGIESQLDKKSAFPNDGTISAPERLTAIPGFTNERVNKLLPYVIAEKNSKINPNTISSDNEDLVKALLLSFKETQDNADAIIEGMKAYAEDEENGPFDASLKGLNTPEVNQGINFPYDLKKYFSVGDGTFVVIARVAIPNQASYFIKAKIEKKAGKEGARIIAQTIY